MRQLIGALMIIGILLGAKQLYQWFQAEQRAHHLGGPGSEITEEEVPSDKPPAGPTVMPGLPPQLEAGYEAASRQGAGAVKIWLNANRRSIQDPRLAAIELDYVVMVAGKDFGEAREVFAAVQARTPTNSPLASRIKKMERSYR